MPNWEDERYVRLYTRDTVTWKLLPWQGKALLPLLLRKVDRAGVANLIDASTEGAVDSVAALTDMPHEFVEPGLAALLRRGIAVIHPDGRLVFPKYIEAQEAKQSDAARKRASRERARAVFGGTADASEKARAVLSHVTECDGKPTEHVTERPPAGQEVTIGHAESPHAVPSLAVPSRAQSGAHPPPAREEHDPGQPALDEDLGPDVAALLAALRAAPHHAADATPELATMLDGRRIAKAKTIAAALAAIAEAEADAVDGETPDARRKRLRSYVENARDPDAPGTRRASGGPSAPAARVLDLYRAIYPKSRRGYGTYASDATKDHPAAESIAAEARRLATERVGAVGGSVEAVDVEIVTHWIHGYLRDNGNPPKFDPASRKHPLAWLARGLAEYGVPWSRASGPQARASPREPLATGSLVGPPPEVTALARTLGRPQREREKQEETGT